MVSIIIKEIMMEPWKNPISTAVSALDMQLSVLDWVSRELADISSYSMACVSLLVMDCLPHGDSETMIDFHQRCKWNDTLLGLFACVSFASVNSGNMFLFFFVVS